MAFGLPVWRPRLRRLRLGAIIAVVLGMFCSAMPAHAESSTLRTYDAEQGLVSLGGACLLQDPAGYMLVCTEHGVFAYDGRRFINLGTDQGLRQGGVVYGLTLTSTGRIAVKFADEVLVSDHPSDAAHPPSSLWFHKVEPGVSFYDERPHRLVSWRDGLVLLAGDTTIRVVVPHAGLPHIEPMSYDVGEKRLLAQPMAVFSVRNHLWEALEDGRLCAADPGAVKCYGSQDGLVGGPWVDVAAGADGQLVARSVSSVATFEPGSGRWSVVDLPDQGGRYTSYLNQLGLFRTPDGGLMTQTDHGLAIRHPEGWRELTVEDGAPSGDIMSAVTDVTGQLWFQVFGRGLVRWVGYGRWESLQKADGISDGIPWQSVRPAGGSLWVSTDTGVNEIVRRGDGRLRVAGVFPGPSFALAVGHHGAIWGSSGIRGAQVIDPANGSVTRVDVPPVDVIVPDGNDVVWIGTEVGLFRVGDHPGLPMHAVFMGSPRTPVPDIVCDRTGGVFYLSGGRLRHRHQDGNDVLVGGAWPTGGFGPISMASGRDGNLWIGGPGGLVRFVVSDDQVSSYEAVPTSDTRTNSVVDVMVDHRGWVWAGTTQGVSVFDGRRWVSVDVDNGLLSDDVEQGGIREDPDGSVWIATTRGFSHLLDPSWIFTSRPLEVVVSQALLGTRPVVGGSMPYTDDALSIQLGTPNYGAERSVLFRYRLSGVDAGWVESSSGGVRYAFVPPGRHVLNVIGEDQMTHQWSRPTTLVVDVAFPWWRRWWSETTWGLVIVGLIYGAMRLRLHAILAREAELKRHVAEATEALRFQAAHDALTGLLTRSEIERRLAAKLSGGQQGEELVIALVDIDHFKRVNDDYGHLGGDGVLRALGGLIFRSVREDEYAGRYGGEEILLVLDDSDGRGAERVLDLHRAVRRDTFKVGGAEIRVTCSIGVAWATAGDDWESLIGRADGALYEAKRNGRDRVIESLRCVPAMSGLGMRGPGPAAPRRSRRGSA